MPIWNPVLERESNPVNSIPVVAVILNWKRPADTLACLRALGDQLPVVVVDNGSGDDSLELIRSAKPDVPLLVLCCCAPPYAHDDTDLLEPAAG